MTRKQCKACPWRKDVRPECDIPNGYCADKHANLKSTISDGRFIPGPISMMACHETPVGKEVPCAGWLANQLGQGGNIGLRLMVAVGKISADVKLVGPQHQRFEDTLPKKRRTAR